MKNYSLPYMTSTLRVSEMFLSSVNIGTQETGETSLIKDNFLFAITTFHSLSWGSLDAFTIYKFHHADCIVEIILLEKSLIISLSDIKFAATISDMLCKPTKNSFVTSSSGRDVPLYASITIRSYFFHNLS